MTYARQVFVAVLQPDRIEVNVYQLRAEAAFSSNGKIYLPAADGSLIHSRIVARESGASCHARHHEPINPTLAYHRLREDTTTSIMLALRNLRPHRPAPCGIGHLIT